MEVASRLCPKSKPTEMHRQRSGEQTSFSEQAQTFPGRSRAEIIVFNDAKSQGFGVFNQRAAALLECDHFIVDHAASVGGVNSNLRGEGEEVIHERLRKEIAFGVLKKTQAEWSGREDSNLRPPAPEAGALPDCATPRTCLLA